MAELSVNSITPNKNVQVAEAGSAPAKQSAAPAAKPAHGASSYDGVRAGRKPTATPKLELKAPAGIKGHSKSACDDLPGSWCAIM